MCSSPLVSCFDCTLHTHGPSHGKRRSNGYSILRRRCACARFTGGRFLVALGPHCSNIGLHPERSASSPVLLRPGTTPTSMTQTPGIGVVLGGTTPQPGAHGHAPTCRASSGAPTACRASWNDRSHLGIPASVRGRGASRGLRLGSWGQGCSWCRPHLLVRRHPRPNTSPCLTQRFRPRRQSRHRGALLRRFVTVVTSPWKHLWDGASSSFWRQHNNSTTRMSAHSALCTTPAWGTGGGGLVYLGLCHRFGVVPSPPPACASDRTSGVVQC